MNAFKYLFLEFILITHIAFCCVYGSAKDLPVRKSPATEFKLSSICTGGVRLINISDNENQIRPFNHDIGYTLSFIGYLETKVDKFNDGILLKAVADNGTNMFLPDKGGRKIMFPSLSKDKKLVIFEVKLNLPKEEVKYIKEISGYLNGSLFNDPNQIDLGITSLKPGSKSSKLSAEIKSINKNKWNEGEVVSVYLNISKDSLKSITFYNEDGSSLPVSRRGYFEVEGSGTTFEYETTGRFPEKCRIVIDLYQDMKDISIPFKVTNITLLGRPVKHSDDLLSE